MHQVAEWVERFNHRYPLSIPVDLSSVLEGAELRVVEHRLGSDIKECLYRNTISVDPSLSRAEKRHLVAHAIGHQVMHLGNHLCLDELDPLQRRRQELSADLFACCLLMPENETRRLLCKHTSVEDIADIFDVPIWLAEQRVNALSPLAIAL